MRDRDVAWTCWQMSRPAQLGLIVVVYLLGVMLGVADGGTVVGPVVVAGLGALLPIAASVHYANEYADYETDSRTNRTRFSGGSGALQRTGLPRNLAWQAGVVALGGGGIVTAAASVVGVSGSAVGVLTAIAVLGWQYSIEPLALVWHGLGEVTNVVLGALLLPLYGYAVVRGRVAVFPILACCPFAILVFVNLLETHWPDRMADAAVGKTTLPVLWSPAGLRRVYAGGVLAYLGSLGALSGWVLPRQVTLTSVVVVPLLGWGLVRYTRTEQPLPGVLAMVALAVLQTLAWGRVAGL